MGDLGEGPGPDEEKKLAPKFEGKTGDSKACPQGETASNRRLYQRQKQR